MDNLIEEDLDMAKQISQGIASKRKKQPAQPKADSQTEGYLALARTINNKDGGYCGQSS